MSDGISAGIQRNIARGAAKLGLSTKTKINNAKVLADNGLSIVHINRVGEGRSMTIAFKGSRNIIEIATSITHPDDQFSRKVGTQKAVEAFLIGKKVRVPMPPFWQGEQAAFIKTLFEIV